MLIIWPKFSQAGLNFLVSAFRQMSFLISSKTISEEGIRENYINHTRLFTALSSCLAVFPQTQRQKRIQPKMPGTENLGLVQFDGLGQEILYSVLFLSTLSLLTLDHPSVNRSKTQFYIGSNDLTHHSSWHVNITYMATSGVV